MPTKFKQIDISIGVDKLWHGQWVNWFKRYCATSSLWLSINAFRQRTTLFAWIDDLLDIYDDNGGFDN
jgi:hypothetical protein